MKTVAFFFVVLIGQPAVRADTTINSIDRTAWAANTGWINFAGNTTDGVVFGETYLSGLAWGAATGWINFGDGSPADQIRWSNSDGSDCGVNHDGHGNLSGLAWGAAIGWINFGWAADDDENRPRVDLLTGEFSGFAYSAATGWINLATGLTTDSMDCVDSDNDGIGDWWELTWFGDLATADANSNYDGDSDSDHDEYVALTDPRDALDFFKLEIATISEPSPGSQLVELSLLTNPARIYQIFQSTDLVDFSSIAPEPFTSATVTLTEIDYLSDEARLFFRAEVSKPLQP